MKYSPNKPIMMVTAKPTKNPMKTSAKCLLLSVYKRI